MEYSAVLSSGGQEASKKNCSEDRLNMAIISNNKDEVMILLDGCESSPWKIHWIYSIAPTNRNMVHCAIQFAVSFGRKDILDSLLKKYMEPVWDHSSQGPMLAFAIRLAVHIEKNNVLSFLLKEYEESPWPSQPDGYNMLHYAIFRAVSSEKNNVLGFLLKEYEQSPWPGKSTGYNMVHYAIVQAVANERNDSLRYLLQKYKESSWPGESGCNMLQFAITQAVGNEKNMALNTLMKEYGKSPWPCQPDGYNMLHNAIVQAVGNEKNMALNTLMKEYGKSPWPGQPGYFNMQHFAIFRAVRQDKREALKYLVPETFNLSWPNEGAGYTSDHCRIVQVIYEALAWENKAGFVLKLLQSENAKERLGALATQVFMHGLLSGGTCGIDQGADKKTIGTSEKGGNSVSQFFKKITQLNQPHFAGGGENSKVSVYGAINRRAYNQVQGAEEKTGGAGAKLNIMPNKPFSPSRQLETVQSLPHLGEENISLVETDGSSQGEAISQLLAEFFVAESKEAADVSLKQDVLIDKLKRFGGLLYTQGSILTIMCSALITVINQESVLLLGALLEAFSGAEETQKYAGLYMRQFALRIAVEYDKVESFKILLPGTVGKAWPAKGSCYTRKHQEVCQMIYDALMKGAFLDGNGLSCLIESGSHLSTAMLFMHDLVYSKSRSTPEAGNRSETFFSSPNARQELKVTLTSPLRPA